MTYSQAVLLKGLPLLPVWVTGLRTRAMSSRECKAAYVVRRRLKRKGELIEVGLKVLAPQAMIDVRRWFYAIRPQPSPHFVRPEPEG